MDYNGVPFSAVTKQPETQMLSQAFQSMSANNPESIRKFTDIMAKVSSPEYQQQISATREVARAAKEAAKSAMSVVKDLTNIATTAAGGAASAATNQQPTTEHLSEAQINELFGFTGNKVDASKLEKAWKKAGSPTDSAEVAKVLAGAGVDNALIAQTFKNMGIEPPAATAADQSSKANTDQVNIDELIARIKKLPAKDQTAILALLKA